MATTTNFDSSLNSNNSSLIRRDSSITSSNRGSFSRTNTLISTSTSVGGHRCSISGGAGANVPTSSVITGGSGSSSTV
ncbi:hypothetical protein BLA29_014304, partial [Euroglyphus maynei]